MSYHDQYKITKGQNGQAKMRIDKIKVMLGQLVTDQTIPPINITEYEATTTKSIDEQLQKGFTLTYNQYGFLSDFYKKLSYAIKQSKQRPLIDDNGNIME